MKNTISANELKTRGVGLLDEMTSTVGDVMISVRGKPKYVVLTVDQYNHLRECELEAAVNETRQDLAVGRIVAETVADHIKRITRG
jgi:prevent-host-death family protein